jgi:hypothetical protein
MRQAEQRRIETERFKNRNALLRNSLTYFQLFSAKLSATTTDPVLVSRIGRLTAAILHLTQDSTAGVIADVDAAMRGIAVDRFPEPDIDTADALVAHARLLRNHISASRRQEWPSRTASPMPRSRKVIVEPRSSALSNL